MKTPCVRFFIWSAVKGNILTTDNLRRRGFITPGVLCAKQLGRTLLIIFFFLHCTVASELWAFMLTLMGLHWMMLRRLINLIIICLGQCGERVISSSWGAIPTCLLWTIWQERNLRQFEGKVHSII